MPMEIHPNEVISMVQYIASQHPDLVLLLRERRSPSSSLEHLFVDSREIEETFWACDRL
jgi:hypothetical protein